MKTVVMKGTDGRKYTLVVAEETVRGLNAFKVVDNKTDKVTDSGWLIISKNGVLRTDRI